MANTKSAIKNARKSVRLHDRNQRVRSRLKTLRRAYQQAIQGSDANALRAATSAFVSAMDKAVKSGVVHRNAANRVKAKAAKHLKAK